MKRSKLCAALCFSAAFFLAARHDAHAADLVIWWDKFTFFGANKAIQEVVAAFEQATGKDVQLVLQVQSTLPDMIEASFKAGMPPDFAFGAWLPEYIPKWALDDRLVDLTDAVGSQTDLFAPDALTRAMLLDGTQGKRSLYALPMGRTSMLIYVWTDLLQQAGFSLEDVPTEWEAFWSFWCNQVQPAVRRVADRDDIWGTALPMSVGAGEALDTFTQFVAAYGADYVRREGTLVIDEPDVRRRLVKAIDSFTRIYLEGCTPPDSIDWTDDRGNNQYFLDKRAVITLEQTSSIPSIIRQSRPDDYDKNFATIQWPLGPRGEPFPIWGTVFSAVVFKSNNTPTAKEFIRFLVAGGWLGHYFNFASDLFIPPLPSLLRQPFWLDPTDQHRMAVVMQVETRPLIHSYAAASGNWRHDVVFQERVWTKAIQRIVVDGVSPEQAVDEAIARVKQVLAE